MAGRIRRSGSGGRGIRLGYRLSSEERGPRDLVRLARLAEDTGFSFALISDRVATEWGTEWVVPAA
jgi:alkanesulfonate monooxygenase SsuD/methylene tetrahydromethanopterin reductase-like flavin-dependent oxidoreductase (luciferase family)